ncbi:hypothetical protein [Robertkochia solimangrovi]|uniref:hypothetical protein n=1 Tax=Robertkochia solimangrovi TaxID=2213046 RepID=UPI001180206A|nr:hypothetical protein [Robertkochia solimangrovi]TRZ44247.1 hypothetical protein DMZ48_06960 [Robertkochia solimangrovi]
MKGVSKIIGWIGAVILMMFSSCVDDVDFDQANDIVLDPAIELSLVYFKFSAQDFAEAEGEPSYKDSTDADLFSQDFFEYNLKAAEFYIEHTNTINKPFFAEVLFFDANDIEIYSVDVSIPASTNGEPVIIPTLVYFPEDQIGILKNTSKITAEIALIDESPPPLDENSEGSIEFNSSAIFYMEFK